MGIPPDVKKAWYDLEAAVIAAKMAEPGFEESYNLDAAVRDAQKAYDAVCNEWMRGISKALARMGDNHLAEALAKIG